MVFAHYMLLALRPMTSSQYPHALEGRSGYGQISGGPELKHRNNNRSQVKNNNARGRVQKRRVRRTEVPNTRMQRRGNLADLVVQRGREKMARHANQ